MHAVPAANGTLHLDQPQDKPSEIDPGVRIGHVHLRVSDLERSLAFYWGVLGFRLMQKFGTQAAFI
jgi:catechol 2,3-dioxygenase